MANLGEEVRAWEITEPSAIPEREAEEVEPPAIEEPSIPERKIPIPARQRMEETISYLERYALHPKSFREMVEDQADGFVS